MYIKKLINIYSIQFCCTFHLSKKALDYITCTHVDKTHGNDVINSNQHQLPYKLIEKGPTKTRSSIHRAAVSETKRFKNEK